MARRPSKHTRPHRELRVSATGEERRVGGVDGRWVVRTMSGAATTKPYTCPGCHRTIATGTPHVVVWPVEAGFGTDAGVAGRRHWHSGCWHRAR